MFGLFAIRGHQFSPRIADLADMRLWRTNTRALIATLMPWQGWPCRQGVRFDEVAREQVDNRSTILLGCQRYALTMMVWRLKRWDG
ncbi:hypothetical protein ACQEVF_57155 [Nonomuraea polychroma]|uniref:hypothetical protein n=1 Tax=Nonomuraea polychroma TaxID=46176 RepID=UPI003D94B13D